MILQAYFDGCCEPINPGGTAAYGALILQDGMAVWSESKIFLPSQGKTSNNVAEYSGFKAILEKLLERELNLFPVDIYGDSRLVIKQMFGRWRIKQGFYVNLARECKELLKRFPAARGHWIPREQNYLADELSKAVLKKAGVKFRIQPEGDKK